MHDDVLAKADALVQAQPFLHPNGVKIMYMQEIIRVLLHNSNRKFDSLSMDELKTFILNNTRETNDA